MTEAEWLAETDARFLLESPGARPSERQRRLFAVACCRHKWKHLTDERARRAVERVEAFADGGTRGDLDFAAQLAGAAFLAARAAQGGRGVQTRLAAAVLAASQSPLNLWGVVTNTAGQPVGSRRAVEHDTAEQLRFARDILGNPFHRIEFDPAWRTSDALALARGIYDERAFDRTPILADALQDVGCDADNLLSHFRDPHATHVRGCWALDLVLGLA